jgi:thioredoxin 1
MDLCDNTFEKEVFHSDLPVLVEFWASWCPPCKMMEPLLNKLEKEYEGKVKIGKLNVDRNGLTAAKFNISGVPTFILFKGSEPVYGVKAAQTEKQLKQILTKV